MKLFICTTQNDRSHPQLVQAAQEAGIENETIYYESLVISDGIILYNQEPLAIGTEDKILIRWPWKISETEFYDYSVFAEILVQQYENAIALDKECLKKFSPFYEDKLFQSYMFNKLQVLTPKTYGVSDLESLEKENLQFPFIIKKRISSRNKNNSIIYSQEELNEFLKSRNISDYIIQNYVKITGDFRIVVLKGEIKGVTKRTIFEKDHGQIGVKGAEKVEFSNDDIFTHCLKIASFLEADLLGFDVLEDEGGNYYFIEANLSPQFVRFDKTVDTHLAQDIIEAIRS